MADFDSIPDFDPDSPGRTPERAHSPCIGICRMDAAGHYCKGCLRSLDEIAAWSTATEESRHAVLRLVAQRRAAAKTAS
jgi:predicted Fe-S protein YdhL (DUF1289 family)